MHSPEFWTENGRPQVIFAWTARPRIMTRAIANNMAAAGGDLIEQRQINSPKVKCNGK